MTLSRVYSTGRRCGRHAHALDDRLGLDGFVSPHAQRRLCTRGADWSFERCVRPLREVAGLAVCDNTVRKVCDGHGGLIRAGPREDAEAARPFREAKGDVEFQTDGPCVHTTGGGREVRLSIFAQRPRGDPVSDLDDGADQRMPAPHARVATAALRPSESLGPPWRRAAGRRGIQRTDELTGRADGAKWIWNEVRKNRPGATGVLDVDPAGAPVPDAAVALDGEGVAAEAWDQARRRTLLGSGASGLVAELGAESGDVSALVGSLGPHGDPTPDRNRGAAGRSLGRGMVEGACKTALGPRLKQTAAWWKVRRRERMAALGCLPDGDQVEASWKKAAG